jgi:hypothetical protein
MKEQDDSYPGLQFSKRHRSRWVRALLLLPFVASLWVSSYDIAEPSLAGIPFFYWYQLLWVALSAVLTGVVYFAER